MPAEQRGPAGGIRSTRRGMRGMIKPTISLQELRAKIGHRAKSVPTHRFWGLHVHVVKLGAAYLEAKRNNGAPGSDGETFEGIEAGGRGAFLRELAADLRAGT